MKARSKLASPAGFLLVLLLFLLLPFVSVSCEMPGVGSVGADYNGGQLAVGARPEVEIPPGFEDAPKDVLGSSRAEEPAPDAGVGLLAIIVTVVLVAGVALPFVPRLAHQVRQRMFGGAALALVAGVLMIVTQAVAQANLSSQLNDDVRHLGDSMPNSDDIADRFIHTEVGFWLSMVLLVAIALLSVGYVYRDKIFPKAGPAASEAED